jgi:hypothetical protein
MGLEKAAPASARKLRTKVCISALHLDLDLDWQLKALRLRRHEELLRLEELMEAVVGSDILAHLLPFYSIQIVCWGGWAGATGHSMFQQ